MLTVAKVLNKPELTRILPLYSGSGTTLVLSSRPVADPRYAFPLTLTYAGPKHNPSDVHRTTGEVLLSLLADSDIIPSDATVLDSFLMDVRQKLSLSIVWLPLSDLLPDLHAAYSAYIALNRASSPAVRTGGITVQFSDFTLAESPLTRAYLEKFFTIVNAPVPISR